MLEFWNGIKERAGQIDFGTLLEEKLGYELPISYEDWIHANHYEKIRPAGTGICGEHEEHYIRRTGAAAD